MRLLKFAERFAEMDRSRVKFDETLCLHEQNRISNCKECVEICPAKAITGAETPVFDQAACRGCLACISACPVGAFCAEDDVPPVLKCLSEIKGESIEIICGKHPQPAMGISSKQTGIRLGGCLAGLGVGGYVTLFAVGFKRVFLRMDACRDCDWKSLAPRVQHQVQHANRILTGWSKEDIFLTISENEFPQKRPLLDINSPQLSRRGLFRDMAYKGKIALACAIDSAMESEHSENREKLPGVDRLRLINALGALPDPEEGWDTSLESGRYAFLHVSDRCDACAACERVCPTNAITFATDVDKTSYRLLFDAKKCIGCGICASVCIPEAIALDTNPGFNRIFGSAEPAVISQGSLTQCAKCNSLFAAGCGRELCSVCDFRKRNPFGNLVKSNVKPASVM